MTKKFYSSLRAALEAKFQDFNFDFVGYRNQDKSVLIVSLDAFKIEFFEEGRDKLNEYRELAEELVRRFIEQKLKETFTNPLENPISQIEIEHYETPETLMAIRSRTIARKIQNLVTSGASIEELEKFLKDNGCLNSSGPFA